MKLNVESEEKRASELHVLLEQKRVVYNNQQQRKESFCLISGSIDAKRHELETLRVRLDKTRNVLAKKKEENDKILAEVSIFSNAQVTAANDKESELLKRIAEFLNTSVESISDEQPDRLMKRCHNELKYAEADNMTKENELRELEMQRNSLEAQIEKDRHLADEDIDQLNKELKSISKRPKRSSKGNKENKTPNLTPVAKIESTRRTSEALSRKSKHYRTPGTKSKTPGTSKLPRKKQTQVPTNLLDTSDASSCDVPITRTLKPRNQNCNISDDEIF